MVHVVEKHAQVPNKMPQAVIQQSYTTHRVSCDSDSQ